LTLRRIAIALCFLKKEGQPMSIYEEQQRKKLRISFGDDGNALVGLIIVNVVIFIVLFFSWIVYRIAVEKAVITDVYKWFILPTEPAKLVLKPWTILTYMFTHSSVLQMFTSMLWLWVFGYILQEMAGNRKLVPIYLYGGLFGAIVYLLAANLVPSLQLMNQPLEGAYCATMAVAVATTTLVPGYRFFPMLNGGIPIWVLTLVYLLFDFALLASGNPAIGAAHLAGAAMGFIYVKQLHAGNDWGEWMHKFYYWFFNMFNPDKTSAEGKKQELFYKTKSEPFTKKPNVTQQRVDIILDKINQHGYHFLTDEEKDILKKASKDL
jgi:membrane associated rhomboid family serine protease